MINYKNKKILITQFQLAQYGGSELVTLELAEYLLKAGAEVIIATNYIGSPIDKEFLKLDGLKIFTINDERLSEYLDNNELDIAWIQHQLMPESLLKRVNKKQKTIYIYHHMSPFYHIEFPNAWRVEQKLADAIVFNARSTRDAILQNGLLDDKNSDRFFELENPAPTAFLQAKAPTKNQKVKKILVVSNHIPNEVQEAMNKLSGNGVEIVFFGIERAKTNKYKRITPDDFYGFDIVVTIAKTVQYALLFGIPVYCYDHFGGPGYLSEDNLEVASSQNFSGRGFDKKGSDQIYDEIIQRYDEAYDFAIEIKKTKAKDYEIGNRLNKLFDFIKSVNDKPKYNQKIDSRDVISYSNYMHILSDYISQQGILYSRIKDVEKENNNLNNIINEIRRSRIYLFMAEKSFKRRLLKRIKRGNNDNN